MAFHAATFKLSGAAQVTIAGFSRPGTKFDPDLIAEEYWRLHAQFAGNENHELVFK